LDSESVINNLGKFNKLDLEKIWNEDKFAGMQEELLQLMIKFQLCYKIPETSDTYIAPQLLTENQPQYDWKEADNLMLRYVYEFMPKGIITRFIVVMHSMIVNQDKVWKSGVILEKNRARAEIIEYYGKREIKIRISGDLMPDLLIIVTHELDKINNSFHQLKYNKMIPCNCDDCTTAINPHFYEYNDLIRRLEKGRKEVECHKSYKMVDVSNLIEKLFKRDYRLLEKIKRDKVFVSYCHKDKDMLDRVKTHLKVLGNENIPVNLWDDTQIKAGMKWSDEIQKALAKAKVAVLLISTDFLASDFVRNNELPHLLEAAKNDGATILPLILKPSRFSQDKILSVFQAVNNPEKPLSKLSVAEQDEVLLKLTDSIAELMKKNPHYA